MYRTVTVEKSQRMPKRQYGEVGFAFGSSKKAKAAKSASSLVSKAYVNRAIRRTEEVKINNLVDSQNLTISTTGGTGPRIFWQGPTISAGTSVFNRIGRSVRLRKVEVMINPILNGAAITSAVDVPMIIYPYLIKSRTNATGSLSSTEIDDMFITSNANGAFESGSIGMPIYPINKDAFILLKKFPPIKLGFANYTATGGISDNNDFNLQSAKIYDVTKFFPKELMFADTASTTPCNCPIYLVVGIQKYNLNTTTTDWDSPLCGVITKFQFTDA